MRELIHYGMQLRAGFGRERASIKRLTFGPF